MNGRFGLPPFATGIILMVLTAAVILGEISRIAAAAGRLVSAVSTLYILAGLLVLIINVDNLSAALTLVFTLAFTPTAAEGGFAVACVMGALREARLCASFVRHGSSSMEPLSLK